MKLQISKLRPGEQGFSYKSSQDGWLKELINHLTSKGYVFQGEMNLSLTVHKYEPDYFLQGILVFGIEQICGRCADAFQFPVYHTFELSLVHIPEVHSPSSRQVSISNKEGKNNPDIIYFDKNEIELVPILEEQFFLSLPSHCLCKDSCKGICQKCGTNLNEKECRCSHSEQNGVFSSLKDFKF